MVAIVLTYFIVSLACTLIPIGPKQADKDQVIYLRTNGVHMDIIIPNELISDDLKEIVACNDSDSFMAFGWGDKEFYLNTPTWGDLTPSVAFNALFLKSESLMHTDRFKKRQKYWYPVPINSAQIDLLNQFIKASFDLDIENKAQELKGSGYSSTDQFFVANRSYSFFFTCNTWVNSAFRKSGIRSCLWTPFDFGLIGMYD